MGALARYLGRWLIDLVLDFWTRTRFMLEALRAAPLALPGRNRPVFAVLLKQIYFTGLESAGIILVVALAIGTVIITQIIGLVGSGNEPLIGKVLIWTVVRELGPLLTALVVVARSGAAIASELGTMKVGYEVETLELLGIRPEVYLVMPRIVGVIFSVMVLTVYFELAAILGGFLVASLGWQVSYERFAEGIYAALSLREMSVSAIKSLFFGLLIGSACCGQGLSVGSSATQVPQAATRGVLQSLFLIVACDGVVTLLSLFLFR